MRKLVFITTIVCLFAAAAAAQGKIASAWTCDKPSSMNSIPVPDHAGHAYGIDQFHCTATKGEIGGVKDKEGTGTEFMDMTGANAKGHGTFVETLANGDKLNISYTSSATMSKDGKLESASNKWEVTEGTGKFKGVKSSGSCTGKGAGDGSSWTCTGSYSMPK